MIALEHQEEVVSPSQHNTIRNACPQGSTAIFMTREQDEQLKRDRKKVFQPHLDRIERERQKRDKIIKEKPKRERYRGTF